MSDIELPIMMRGISREEFHSELHAEHGIRRDRESWMNCYFHRIDSDLLHGEGECMVCDWKRHINNVGEKDIRNWSFIEAWEWHDMWQRKHSKLNN